jgi:hypothetical protein
MLIRAFVFSFFIGFLSSAVSCGIPVTECSAKTCDGCCDENGKCQTSSEKTCGRGGTMCAACTFGKVCQLGSCISLNNPSGGAGETGGGISASGGGISASGGGISASGGGISASGGGISASGGGISASGGGISASGGGISASGGGISASGGGISASGGGSSFCNASNCAGCCDSTGVCLMGSSSIACGNAGSSCSICATTQSCQRVNPNSPFGGNCQNNPPTGGGGAAGGGSAAGGGTSGSCGPSNCVSGCCTAAGTCITQTNGGRCGKGGQLCQSCPNANTCVAGSCAPCAGCVDLNNGLCQSGNTNLICGRLGQFCQSCDTTNGLQCVAGMCTGSVCNANSCPTGCCDGNTCIQRAQFSTAQCGSGSPGGQCTSCPGTQSCDLNTGVCAGSIGVDAGGGTGICDVNTPCSQGQCCSFGVCITNGTSAGIGKFCGPNGLSCTLCGIGKTCSVNTGVCL